jgi:glucose/arabinose dehydrogenase
MIRRASVIAAVIALSLAGWNQSVAEQRGSTTGRPAGHVTAISATPVVTGLAFPAAFTVGNDRRIYYGERFTGRIRIFNPATGSDTLWTTIPNISNQGERGLLGLQLLPGSLNLVGFVYATRLVNGVPTNQIIEVSSILRVIFSSNTPSQLNHNGGRILFGPDGNLYAVIGDAQSPGNSQDLAKHAGKILRMTPSGGVPGDNPFPGNLVWSYGHRNSYGFTFDPLSGRLWQTENGPECNDEINLVAKGANYGWGPHETCSSPPPPPANTNQDGPNPVMPLAWFTPTTAPTGAAFCVGCGIPSSEGAMFFGTYNTNQITRVVLDANRTGIASMQVVYTHPRPILSIERGPDKVVYFSDTQGIYKLVGS